MTETFWTSDLYKAPWTFQYEKKIDLIFHIRNLAKIAE